MDVGVITPRKHGVRDLPTDKQLANLRPPWKKGETGNPNGRPKRKTFEELVEIELDPSVPGSDMVGREALAKIFASQLLSKRNKDAFSHYIRRAWPEVSKHELTAEIDVDTEVEIDLGVMESDDRLLGLAKDVVEILGGDDE